MADLVVASDPIAAAAARVEEAVRAVDAEREAARLAIPGGSAAAVVGPVREALGEVWRRALAKRLLHRCAPQVRSAMLAGDQRQSGHGEAKLPRHMFGGLTLQSALVYHG